MTNPFRDQSEYLSMGTPRVAPLDFSPDGYYRVMAKITCKKCGGQFTQGVRCHRFRNELGTVLPVAAPDPNNARIVTSIMLAAHNHGVGNRNFNNQNVRWRPQGWNPNDPDQTGQWVHILITDRHHTAMCPVGQMKRTGAFTLATMEPTMGRA